MSHRPATGGVQPEHPAQALPDAQRRRLHRAWYFYDWANSGFVTTTYTVLLSPYMKAVAEQAACPGLAEGQVCRETVSLLGLAVSPGSLPFYVTTLATIMATVLLPMVGALADRSPRPRLLMSVLAWAGAAAAASMALAQGGNWQLLVVAELVAVMCHVAAMVVYDAILVSIATPDERDAVSSRGWSLGYAGGFLLLVLNLALVSKHEAAGLTQSQAVRVSLFTAGLWWAVFTVVPFIGLRRLPKGPAPDDGRTVYEHVRASSAQLIHTIRELAGYRNTWMFLVAAWTPPNC